MHLWLRLCLLAAGDSVTHAQDEAALYKKGIAAFEAGDFEAGRRKVLDHFSRRRAQRQWDLILADIALCTDLLGDDYRRIFPEDAWLDLELDEAMFGSRLSLSVANRSDRSLHNATLVLALHLTDMHVGDYATVVAGDTVPEVAILSSRISDGRNVAEVKNAFGPTQPSAVWFLGASTAKGVQSVNDADGNGVPEVATLSVRDSDGRIVVQVKNASGPTNANALWYTPGFAAQGMVTIADTDGNGIDEVLVLMIRNSDGRILVQGRNAAGAPETKDYWFLP